MSVLNDYADEIRKLFQNKKFTLEDRKMLRELGATDEITTSQALAVLFAEVAMIDQDFDEREYGFIIKHLGDNFSLEPKEVKGLIAYGTTLIENLQSTEQFTSHLRQNLDSEQRSKLLDVINGLIFADGVEHGFEVYLRDRLKKTLEIKS